MHIDQYYASLILPELERLGFANPRSLVKSMKRFNLKSVYMWTYTQEKGKLTIYKWRYKDLRGSNAELLEVKDIEVERSFARASFMAGLLSTSLRLGVTEEVVSLSYWCVENGFNSKEIWSHKLSGAWDEQRNAPGWTAEIELTAKEYNPEVINELKERVSLISGLWFDWFALGGIQSMNGEIKGNNVKLQLRGRPYERD